ncbi:GNAT family N-acetyltransferase [Arthrobacter sp. JSM 101049]|uniref:GNAT family N-acetyltransferase n=1 Tax=Arthrobacter sp. JSM 101049 TaxID=929097 RepID=UPI003568F838
MGEETQPKQVIDDDGLAIVTAGAATWDEVETLFGPTGAYGGCWCLFWRQTNQEANESPPDGNHAELRRLVTSGEPIAVLARRGETVLGWCQVAPREQFHRLFHTRALELGDDGGHRVFSIVCLFVDRSARGQGIAGALVSGAVDLARRHGATLVEAYPLVQAPRRTARLSSGTVDLFTRAGFRSGPASTSSRTVMTLPLDQEAR